MSLLFPGLGQVYCGRLRTGVIWALFTDAFFLSAMLMCVVLPASAPIIFWGRFVAYGGLRLAQAAQAWELASRPAPELRRSQSWWVYCAFALVTWAVSTTAAHGVRALLIEPFREPSTAMEPTLAAGDEFFAVKRGPASRLERGAIVAWRNRARHDVVFIARVVALPGDRLTVTGGVLSAAGRSVERTPCSPETYTYLAADGRNETGRCFIERDGASTRRVLFWNEHATSGNGQWVVPEGSVFMLGDHRQEAVDSRYVGAVPIADIIGRAWAVHLSWSPVDPLPRFDRIGRRL